MLKVLCKVVEDVKIVVIFSTPTTELQDPPETSKVEPNIILVPSPPIKVEVSGGVLDLGTLEFNNVTRDIR